MKQQAVTPTISPALHKIFIITLITFLFSLFLFLFFFTINKSIARTDGKIIDKFTRTEAAGRKRTQEREVYSVQYSINNKEYTRQTPQPRNGRRYSREERIPIYYYPNFPGLSWFFKKSNHSMAYSVSLLVIATLLFGLSWRDVRSVKKAAVKPAQKGHARQP